MKPLGHKNAAAGDEICRGREQNYFQGLEIYFRGLEIYFKALEIYFRATEKVLFRAAKDFASCGGGFCIGRQSILHRAAKAFASSGGGFYIGRRRILHRTVWNYAPGWESACFLFGWGFPKAGRKVAKGLGEGHNTLINYNKCVAMVGYSVKSRTFARNLTL